MNWTQQYQKYETRLLAMALAVHLARKQGNAPEWETVPPLPKHVEHAQAQKLD